MATSTGSWPGGEAYLWMLVTWRTDLPSAQALRAASGPIGRSASHPTKEDNAAVVVYLLSAAAEKVNGQIVRVMTGVVTLLSHPFIVTPGAELKEFSFETVARAFKDELNAHLQPVGIAAGPAPELELIL